MTIALVLEAVVGSSGQRERAPLPLFGRRVAQIWSSAVADIIDARRAWTVAMISSVSMPLVPELGRGVFVIPVGSHDRRTDGRTDLQMWGSRAAARVRAMIGAAR